MISYFQNKKNQGMTYIELIVVLGIFAAFGGLSIVNYRQFQSKIYLKTLANDVALKIVEAQKNSMSGKWTTAVSDTWKPSYGVYLNRATDDKSFKSFVDRNQDKYYTVDEVLDTFTITKGNSISELKVFYQNGTSTNIPNDLHLTFTRPDGGATMMSSTSFDYPVLYLQITIASPAGATTLVKLYSSGRIQLN